MSSNDVIAVLNPAALPYGLAADDYLPICFAMLGVCDTVYMLPNWKDSAGATLEHGFAQYQHKTIVYL